MNILSNRLNFNTLGQKEIAAFIEQSESIIILAIPSLTLELATSITQSKALSKQIIFAQKDPTQCRTTQHMDAVKLLISNNVMLRVSDAFAIGTLVVDDKGWLFSTIPDAFACVNSYSVSVFEADRLIESLSAKIVNEPVPNNLKPELGETILVPDVMEQLEEEQQAIKNEEESKRALDFDVEFVELEFKGIRIGSRKISIPKQLTQLGMDEKVKDILSSSAKLFSGEHSFVNELKKLEDGQNQIRNDYLFTIKNYGTMIRKKRKDKFSEAISVLQEEVKQVQQSIHKQLKTELNTTKNSLIAYYIPLLKANPPEKLLKYHDNVDDKTAEHFIDHLLSSALPNVESIVQDIQLICHFKGVSIEMLNEEKFITLLDQTMNGSTTSSLFDESDKD
jgi:hypothetical protein